MSDEFTLRDYLHIISKRKFTVIIITLLMVISVGIYTYLQKPIYRVNGKIYIKKSPDILSRNRISNFLKENQKIYIQKIRSFDFLKKVAEELKKENKNRFSYLTPSYISRHLRVYFNKENYFITLFYEDSHPHDMAPILNKIMENFVKYFDIFNNENINETINFIKSRLEIVKTSLLKAENELKEFQKKNNVFSLPNRILKLQDKLISLDSQKENLKSQLKEIDYTVKVLQKELDNKLKNNKKLQEMLINPTLKKYKKEIENLNNKLKEYQDIYSSQHPKIIELKKKIKDLEEKYSQLPKTLDKNALISYQGINDPILKTIIQNLYQLKIKKTSLKIKISVLEKTIKMKTKQFSNLPESNLTFARLQRKLKVTEALYSNLLVKYNEMQLAAATKEIKAGILSKAFPPKKPIKPNMKNNLIVALISGIIIGLSFAFIIDSLDNTIRSPEEGKRIIKSEVMGMIPLMKENEKSDKNLSSNLDPILVTYHFPQSIVSESFRALRTNLLFQQQNNKLKTIMITNPSQAKGKTTIISNLAISIAYTGKNVLLIDADLRKPYLHKLFRLPNNVGLTSIFYGSNPEDVVQQTSIEGLSLLTSGPIPPNPSELISSATMDEIINFYYDKYDIILFDSTPVVAVTDASILSNKVDGTLFMICVREDSKQQVKKGYEILNQIKANIIGVVYNKVRERELGGYYYRYG